jgi:hypothetical protein
MWVRIYTEYRYTECGDIWRKKLDHVLDLLRKQNTFQFQNTLAY